MNDDINASNPLPPNMHLLLVEDNSADADLLIELMEQHASDVKIHWVLDGKEALNYVRQRESNPQALRPNFILLDLGLPRISGYEVLKELKKSPQYSAIPVVIITTSRNGLDTSQCRKFGADHYISKPRSLEGYERMVHQLLDVDFPRLLDAA